MHECMHDLRSDFCVLLIFFLNLQTSVDVSKIHNELNEKTSEIRRLQIELSRREDEDPNVSLKSLKGVIATLEKENANLKVSCILNVIHARNVPCIVMKPGSAQRIDPRPWPGLK